MQFEPPFLSEVRRALRKAFPNDGDFDLVPVDAGLNEQWVSYLGTARNLDSAVHKLLEWAKAHRCLINLLEAAIRQNSVHEDLIKVTERLRRFQAPLSELGAGLGELETVFHDQYPFEDIGAWLEKLSRIRSAVCRVEPQPIGSALGKRGFGTGFLIAPDIVITNWHVAASFWEKERLAEQVVLRFDYEDDALGHTKAGQPVKLARDWSLPTSPEDECDFALLRLERRADEDTVNGQRRACLRFLEMTEEDTKKLSTQPPLLILQHPDASPLKLAFGSIVRYEPPRYIYYRVNTTGGSSGAPCLSPDLDVIGLHHYGMEKKNRGIVSSAITPKINEELAKSRLPVGRRDGQPEGILASTEPRSPKVVSAPGDPLRLSVKRKFERRVLVGHTNSVNSSVCARRRARGVWWSGRYHTRLES
jgi:hypothetical protein